MTNAERAKAGCPALTDNAQLRAAARGHSNDMASKGYFSHTSQDGSSMADRVSRTGYQWSRLGENIAMGQPTPESVVSAWMNSSGHRANILNCGFRDIGVGVAGGSRPYWTQDFGTSR